MDKLAGPQLRKLKAMAQKLEPMLTLGKAGMSEGFLRMVNEALDLHEIIKVKFGEFKEQKKELAKGLSEKTSSHIVMQVGHVVVLYRQQADPEKRKVSF